MKWRHSISWVGLIAVACLACSFGCSQEEDGWAGGDASTEQVSLSDGDTSTPTPSPAPAPANSTVSIPSTPGQVMTVGSGTDPDVAVDSQGHLHLVYVRDGVTWYTEYDYATGSTIVPEVVVGGGDDPQIALDSNDRAHVAFGNVFYSHRSGSGFSTPVSLVSGKGKPRIAVDSMNRVYVVGMRSTVPRNLLFVFENNNLIVNGIVVGDNDMGGIDVDSYGRAHICWRSGRSLYYTSYRVGEDTGGVSDRSVLISGTASDFSDIAVDHRDGSLHVTHTHSFGGGIDYIHRNGAGAWGTDFNYAADHCLDGADAIQPTTAVDASGFQYVVFTGNQMVPKYYVVGQDGSSIAVPCGDIDASRKSGGKKQNPNVASRPNMNGAYVAWGMGAVYVRSLGNISFAN